MNTPYEALLSVRQVEEQQAELAMAEALGVVTEAEKALRRVRATRTAWLAEPVDASMSELMADLECAERDGDRRLQQAERVAAEARAALLERRRAREVVEKLHQAALAAAALEAARRAQREMDEFGSRAVGAFAREDR